MIVSASLTRGGFQNVSTLILDTTVISYLIITNIVFTFSREKNNQNEIANENVELN